MKNTSYVAFGMLAVIMLVTPACDWLKRTAVVSEPAVRIIDVNTMKVYTDAHIPGAIHLLSLDELEEASKDWHKKTAVILYCSDYTCMASHLGANKLFKLKFTDVAVYAGGISEWYKLSKDNKEKYPLEGPAQLEFLEKEVEKIEPEEGIQVVSAQEVAQWLEELKK